MPTSANDILPPPGREAPAPAGPRVLQVLPALGEGGVERGTIDVARFLTERGWVPLVTCTGGPGESELLACGAKVLHLPLESKNPLVMWANVGRLQRLIRAHEVQLVHARSRAPAWSAYLAARRCRVPFVTTFHSVYGGSETWWNRAYNSVMVRGERVIAISEYVAEHVQARYGVPSSRVRTIFRGLDPTEFDPETLDRARIEALRNRWRVAPGTRIVLLPGRVTRRKGHQVLVRALDRLGRRDFVCLFVGGRDARSGYGAEVDELVKATGLGAVVHMVGSCDDMPAAYALADVVVVPSITPEAFGRVSVEAQAMGKPVIASDIGGLGETVMPAATGWLVPPDDVAALADALELALNMPDETRARLATRARNFVAQRFTLERMGHKTLAVYRELIDGRRPGPPAEETSGGTACSGSVG